MIKAQQLFQLYFGEKYTNKQISDRFHEWRKSSDKDDETRFRIMIDGARSQKSDFSKQWKWIVIQVLLWLWISYKYELLPVVHVMAFLSIFIQFSLNAAAVVTDKKQLFSAFIGKQISDLRSVSTLLWDVLEEMVEDPDEIMKVPEKNVTPDVEWPDIMIELVGNKYDDSLPFIRTVIGHDASSLIHPAEFGLTHKNDRKKATSAFTMLKLFAEHNPFRFKGHGSQKNSVEKRVLRLRDIFSAYFGERGPGPISRYQESIGWECYINVEDRTNTWKKIEHDRYNDVTSMLDEWTFIDEQVEAPEPGDDTYSQKGWDW